MVLPSQAVTDDPNDEFVVAKPQDSEVITLLTDKDEAGWINLFNGSICQNMQC